MRFRRLRLILAVLILLVALGLLLAAGLPYTRFQQVIPLPPVFLPGPAGFLLQSLGWLLLGGGI